jgi:hypothetical protein
VKGFVLRGEEGYPVTLVVEVNGEEVEGVVDRLLWDRAV